MKKISLVLLMTLVVVSVAFAGGEQEKKTENIVWRFPSLESGPGYWSAQVMVNFSEAVAKRTDGRLRIDISYAGELGINPTDFLTALQSGAIQMGHGSTAYYARDIEGCAISAMPMVAVGSYQETINLHKDLRDFINKQLEQKYKVKVLWMIPWEFVQPMTTKEIRDFTNLNGMKLRVSGLLTGDLVKLSNGVPVSMPLSEVYTSLGKGVIDGAVVTIPALEHNSLHEVVKYVYNFYYHSAASIYLISIDALNALPEDVRKIVLEEAARVEALGVELASKGMEEGQRFARTKSSVRIIEPTKEDITRVQQVAKSLWDTWYQSASAEGKEQFARALSRTGVTYKP